MGPRSGPDLAGWLTTAALFWFEAIGLMGLAAAYLLSPIACIAAQPGCAPGERALLQGGLGPTWLGVLLAVGVGSLVVWSATEVHRHARAWAFLFLGLAAIGTIGLATIAGSTTALSIAFWMGWPGIILIATWVRRLGDQR